MSGLFDKLPTILVLAVLVGVFLSLRRHAPSASTRLWTYAWALVFLHFFMGIFEPRNDTVTKIVAFINYGALELSGIVFVVSMISVVEDRSKRLGLLTLLGIPAMFHFLGATFEWQTPWTLAAPLVLIFFGGAAFSLFVHRKPHVFNILVAVLLAAAGTWAVHNQLRGSPNFAINAILTLSFGLSGAIYWRRYPRRSPGVIATSGGFFLWGAVWPIAALLGSVSPNLSLNPEIWNVPKYFVALGMVVAILEDKTRFIEAARLHERAENQLLMRLSQITSRVLAGKDPAALCKELAEAVTSTTSFGSAALFLVAEGDSLHLAGSNGFSPEGLADLRKRTVHWTTETLREICARGPRVGNNSFCVSGTTGGVVIPLVSWRGSHLGCFWLSGMKPEAEVGSPEVLNLEVLASDLAMTIENARLHSRLARSEKLAALGQLVAGVAHELNNPLTGIIGYAELLSEEVENPTAIKRIQKLGNEGRRMKRIVDGLLRFARQSNPAARATDLESALHDVVQLREYQLCKCGIHIEVLVDPLLPPLAIGEDELKQIVLNVLNNAIDAVAESAERAIRIRASRCENSVVIQFEDSGPGFSDLNRAFDPFYTTKPVGKGTGLGLSICYGIVQECGGEITITNRQPFGASVVVEIPVAVSQPVVPLPTKL